MSVVTKIDETTWLNEFGGLVSNSGHASPDIMINVNKISKWYGDFQVLTDCTAHVHKGDVTVICGPSGSGKSTLIKTVNGLEAFQQGEILIDGMSVGAKETDLPKLRSRVGMVFQHFELFPHLSILENLTLAQIKVLGRSQSEAQKKGLGYLDRVGLSAHAKKYPAELSGGQQQRLCIARGVAVKPSILLLDEPTSALDPISTAKVEELVHELKKDYTIAIVTHNMQQAARVSDFTAYMYLGEMVEFGKTDELFIKPKRKETEDYITGRFG